MVCDGIDKRTDATKGTIAAVVLPEASFWSSPSKVTLFTEGNASRKAQMSLGLSSGTKSGGLFTDGNPSRGGGTKPMSIIGGTGKGCGMWDSPISSSASSSLPKGLSSGKLICDASGVGSLLP